MSRKNKVYSVHCPKMSDILANNAKQRFSLASTTSLHPSHFEPQSLPSIAFEFDAIINGSRYQGLKGEADIGEEATFRIDADKSPTWNGSERSYESWVEVVDSNGALCVAY